MPEDMTRYIPLSLCFEGQGDERWINMVCEIGLRKSSLRVQMAAAEVQCN